MAELAVIIVSYNTKDLLRTCLESLCREVGSSDAHIMVVDNGSTDGSEAIVRKQFSRVQWVENGKNLGFAAAINIGVKKSSGEYILFLNPDVTVLEGGLSKTLKYIHQHSEVGIVGCKILSPDGSVQQSARELPTLWTLFLENSFLYKLLPHTGLLRNPWVTDVDREQEVDIVKGAFLVIRREALESVGGLDERFFLYSEEQDLCLRVKKAGWNVMYVPVPAIVHYEGGSSVPGKNSSKLMVYESEYKYFRKHYGTFYAKAASAIMVGGLVTRIFVWFIVMSASLLRSGMRKQAKERVVSYWYALGRSVKVILGIRLVDGPQVL